ncbi:diguanylate cyclase [Candidatus Magnetobacterium bavaricum]|uniref:diguanylate cyclase n=1 Tax=Candidatus Magnetobacterium bavaricum TaxID=29290 RepID=A0A0F3GXX1_9BACT|nr:diguanylate cyclase [Candidatus Magnetobacterium bavaricum]
MKDSIGINHGVLVLKNPEDDYLTIVNRYNISAHFKYHRGIGTDVVGRVFYKDPVVVVTSDSAAEDYKDMFMEDAYEVAIAAGVSVDGCTIGFVAVYFDKVVDDVDSLQEFLLAMARLIAEVFRKERLASLLNELRDIDPTTGLVQYHFFHKKLHDELERSHRHKLPLTLVIMDMDNFKSVLNNYGIEIARLLYTELSDHLKSCIRGIDVLGRYGTDEFILYMPNTSIDKVKVVIERFQETLKMKRFTEKNLCTTLSIGIATLKEQDTLHDLLTHAKIALYSAKVTGKGAVECGD